MNQQDDIALDPAAGTCRMTATEFLARSAAARIQAVDDLLTYGTVSTVIHDDGRVERVDPANFKPDWNADRARAHVCEPNLAFEADAFDPLAGCMPGVRNAALGLGAAQTGLFAPEPTSGVNVSILALDLGTKTGYAVRRRDGKIVHGTMSFAPRTSWTPGQRWLRFRSWLGELLDLHQVDRIAYEHVSFHAGVRDAHCYGAFRALVEMAADTRRIELVGTNVQTVKKHWTGKGGADKAAMIEQARKRGFRPETDNDADALAVLDWAVAQERKA